MKKLTIDGRTFDYKVFCTASEWDTSYRTEFYEGTEEYTKRKYVFFGEKQTLIRPKRIFTVYINIEDPGYTKKHVKEKIDQQISLLNRAEEIANGNII